MIGKQIRIIQSIDDIDNGKLPIGLIGKTFTVTSVVGEGFTINDEKETLVLKDEYELVETTEDILQSCKDQMELHINKLLEQGVRKANLEITLLHYMKKIIYTDRD